MISPTTRLLSALILLSNLLPLTAVASNVWDYARERAQRQAEPEKSEKKTTIQPEQEKPPVRKKSAPRPVTPAPAPSTIKSAVKKKLPQSPQKVADTIVKKIPATVVTTPPQPPVHAKMPEALAPALVKTAVIPQIDTRVLDAAALNVGHWIKKALNAIKATPDEQRLQDSYKQLSRSQRQLAQKLDDSQDKLKMQQTTLQLLQRRLKEAQSPALPEDTSRREVFAAGMAAGYGLLDLIQMRHEMGIDLPKSDFMAGVQEAMNNGKRLPQQEFETLLASITEKVSEAEMKIQQQREKNDLRWKTAFSRETSSKQSDEGIWYQQLYSGDRQIDNDEYIKISLSRKLINGETLDDSDLSGHYLFIKKENAPPLLKGIIEQTLLHSEIKIAMPVDTNGIPYKKGPFYEEWNIRIADANKTYSEDSN